MKQQITDINQTIFKWNEQGLIAVIAQDINSQQILMQAWMNKESLDKTLNSGDAWYYSRSRQKLWRKGEESGNTQQVIEMYLDCDGDSILIKVKQTGPACHTGAISCFFTRLM